MSLFFSQVLISFVIRDVTVLVCNSSATLKIQTLLVLLISLLSVVFSLEHLQPNLISPLYFYIFRTLLQRWICSNVWYGSIIDSEKVPFSCIFLYNKTIHWSKSTSIIEFGKQRGGNRVGLEMVLAQLRVYISSHWQIRLM